MTDNDRKQMNKDWLKKHNLSVGECEIRQKCPLYASRFIGDKVKKFACESAKGNLYTSKNDEIIAVLKCPYLSLAEVKTKPNIKS